ncbi:GATA transcription factor 11-like isoform X2 [Brassica napus]|uniref:GATA transcription factor 11-like isoform X2 n=1 Tax=Brassica napus TaxID=3708 RepID=UPI002078EF30|nr:GATA transcription factor 11-like isoform X2 [Brassica napus]
MNWLPEEEFKGLSDNFFDDFINHIDFPLEDIDTTNGEGDWDAKFKELEPPPMDMFTTFPSEFNSCGVASKDGIKKNVSVLSDASAALSGINDTLHQSSSHHDAKVSKLFQSSSPVSVLESSDGSFSPQNSTSQRLTFPVKGLRSKRKRPTTLRRRHLYPFKPEKLTPEELESSEQHAKKKRKIFTTNHTVSSSSEELNSDGVVRRCTHCETTKTPQWREGPNGPKTLCNACGVRFRSGRLVPEYRPASSPTFIPSVHSNSHRKIIEMRSREGDQFDKRAV